MAVDSTSHGTMTINASKDSKSASQKFRIWKPQNFRIQTNTNVLKKIDGTCTEFQKASLTVRCDWIADSKSVGSTIINKYLGNGIAIVCDGSVFVSQVRSCV